MQPLSLKLSLVLICVLIEQTRSNAEDWYRFRGPRLDGVSMESVSVGNWGDHGPKIAWNATVGTGLSSVSIRDGRLFTMGNEDNVDTVFCIDAATGNEIWKHSYASATDPNEFEGGPTSTPTVDGDQVYTLGRQGDVFCFDAKSGDVIWKVNAAQLAEARVPAWGFSGSPLVWNDLLMLNVGDAATALEKSTGKLAWKSADKDSGYSSIVPIGDDKLVFGSARSYVCVEARTGREIWRQRWLTTFGCNAADPIVSDNTVFLSSGYNRGSALLAVENDEPVLQWKHKDFQNQLSSSVLIDGFLYGIHGDVDDGAALRCIEHSTGKILWTSEGIRAGALTATREHLVVLSDSGELVIARVSPEQFLLLSRHQVLDAKCWTAPVISNGCIYCRDVDGNVICVDAK